MIFLFVLIALVKLFAVQTTEWPIPYERETNRTDNDPYCQAGLVPFCPTGKTTDSMIFAGETDTIEIFALKKPVWSFKFGDLLAKFKVMHDALGFHNKNTGQNWTMEWYELDQLFNCTFPHVLKNDSFIWCNQGALCTYEGINDSLWLNTSDLSMLLKVGEISGHAYNLWANWSISDNNTGIYYETWTVYSDPSQNATMYFDSYDCASFVIRGLDHLKSFGASFYPNIHLNYTRINLYSSEPQRLGTYDQIVANQSLHADFVDFYRSFDKSKPTSEDWLTALLEIYSTFFVDKRFYFYYNNVYWYLKLNDHIPLEITFDEVPIGSAV